MERLTSTDRSPFSPTYVQRIWRRLLAIEDILGDDYDLKHLKALVTGDTYTEEDMSAAYTSGYEIGRKQREEKTCGPCPAIHAVKAMAVSDLQPVVRCKDCAMWKWAKANRQGVLICPRTGMAIMANDYCSKGEGRRDNADT